ncbi:MAG: hypothetical protein JJT89_17275 [Nitriliruptoraceae bacterium]|nr:hypothetical protein [Nitriliruptoraceae bacterium]
MLGSLVAVAALSMVVAAVGLALAWRPIAGRADVTSLDAIGDVEAARLLGRWRDRSARWRAGTAGPTVVVVLVLSVVLRGGIDVGVGVGSDPHPAWADPLLLGVLAVFLGTIGAELHHLRRDRSPAAATRTAALEVRTVDRYHGVHAPRRLALVVGSCAVVGAATAVAGRVPWLALVALVIGGAVPVVTRSIARRARPALPGPLRAADELVRRLATASVHAAGVSAVVLLTGWQLGGLSAEVAPGGVAAMLLVAVPWVAVVVAVVWWRQSHPDRLLAGALAESGSVTHPADAGGSITDLPAGPAAGPAR